MGSSPQTTWLNYSQAARRVGRSERTVMRWRRECGMAMGWRVGVDGQRERVVREDVLLKAFRDSLRSSPVHFYRMRKLAREEGLPEPVRPVSVSQGPKRVPVAVPLVQVKEGRPAPDMEPLSLTQVDPLLGMKPLRAVREWGVLREGLKEDLVPCLGLDAFTADTIDPEEAPLLAAICADCPMINRCCAFAEVEKPASGFWAGQPAPAYR